MLDPKFIRLNIELVRQAIANKGEKADLDKFIEADERRREIITKVETLKAERNAVTGEIAKLKKTGGDASGMIEKMRAVGEDIATLDKDLQLVEERINETLLWIPNLPHL